MKEQEKKTTHGSRFRHKLNMLEQGTILLKWMGLLFVLGLAFLLPVVLLAIEAHQDKVLYEPVMQEDRKRDDHS